MKSLDYDADVIVVGGGHAGCEAAAASARSGAKTLLISGNLDALGRMSCNPAIGGIAKGHLVREIDALGGIMGLVTDRTAIQYRVLNRSKGVAVWSPRAQCDRVLYNDYMVELMRGYPGITLHQGMVRAVYRKSEETLTVQLEDDSEFSSRSIVLTCGTFLNGLMHTGDSRKKGGRFGEPPVVGLTKSIVDLGFTTGRLKTGTPPRLDGSTINFSLTERQDGDAEPIFFHWNSTATTLPQRPCWITHTNDAVHEELKAGLHRSPLYTGRIEGRGPRYCPSIEDKIVRFADKSSHTIFLEPEGLNTNDYYPNGFSTSLPADVQVAAIRKIPGLENVELTRPGYAVEYDYFPPHQLQKTLETKLVPGLFFAGQINGTSGYEEAAAQGLIAGVNAAQAALGKGGRLTLGREEAYIGVMIDDLITLSTDEPYRMFTSRAEYRLHLRLDNAESRLIEKGIQFGIVPDEQKKQFDIEEQLLLECLAYLAVERVTPPEGQSTSLYEMLKRPEVKLLDLLSGRVSAVELVSSLDSVGPGVVRRIEAEIKYEGYIRRQESRVQDLRRNREKSIPLTLDFKQVRGLSTEAAEKLQRIKPADFGQAANIQGVTPADMAVLLIHIRKMAGVAL